MSSADGGSGSIAFDRAASWYDASRRTDDENTLREVELVVSELRGRDRVLELGTGTGAIGLRLHDAGFRMTAVDLSMPMLRRLLERAGGAPAFPLVQAEATRMPFRDDTFDGAIARWVFHLIPNWPDALAEVARVVRPGGVFLINAGGVHHGPWAEVRERMSEEVGRELRPAGLVWRDFEALDAAAARLGMRPRELPPIEVVTEEPLGQFLDGIARNHYSWLWPLEDEERLRASAAVRTWAEERFGPLDRTIRARGDALWRAYDLPADGRAAPPGH
ncbi:MAG: class I SAM-dependent methyltransferase [Actinomycetota bacterium]